MIIQRSHRDQGKGTGRAGRKSSCAAAWPPAACPPTRKASRNSLDKAVADAGLQDEVEVRGVGCMKLCCEGPLVGRSTRRTRFTIKVTPENAPSIVAALKGGKTERRSRPIPTLRFSKSNCPSCSRTAASIDPERIESYIAADGYQALHEVLHEMTPKEVVEAMVKSGLRGRGGAGFPTGLKWGTVAKSPGAKKYVICNADEGDPGAFMDRSVLESDPHSVLEGMAIAAYAVGADQGFIYVRAEYPLAITRLQIAIKQAKTAGPARRAAFLNRRSISTWTSASARARLFAARKPR